MTTIYCIHCITTGKKYVGLTRQPVENRIKQHFKEWNGRNPREKRRRLYSAMEKYGRENFIWGIITECEDSLGKQEEMCYIKSLNAYPQGYNCDWGGSSCVHSPETRAKMSATWKSKGTSNRKGKKNTEESNEKRRQTLIARYKDKPHHRKGKTPWNKKSTN